MQVVVGAISVLRQERLLTLLVVAEDVRKLRSSHHHHAVVERTDPPGFEDLKLENMYIIYYASLIW